MASLNERFTFMLMPKTAFPLALSPAAAAWAFFRDLMR